MWWELLVAMVSLGLKIDLFDLMSPWARVVSLSGSSSERSSLFKLGFWGHLCKFDLTLALVFESARPPLLYNSVSSKQSGDLNSWVKNIWVQVLLRRCLAGWERGRADYCREGGFIHLGGGCS